MRGGMIQDYTGTHTSSGRNECHFALLRGSVLLPAVVSRLTCEAVAVGYIVDRLTVLRTRHAGHSDVRRPWDVLLVLQHPPNSVGQLRQNNVLLEFCHFINEGSTRVPTYARPTVQSVDVVARFHRRVLRAEHDSDSETNESVKSTAQQSSSTRSARCLRFANLEGLQHVRLVSSSTQQNSNIDVLHHG